MKPILTIISLFFILALLPCIANCETDIETLQKKAATGDVKSQVQLGDSYLLKKDYAEALKWYQKAAEQGHAAAQVSIGNMYYKGQVCGRTKRVVRQIMR